MKNNDYIYYNQVDRFAGMNTEQVDDLLAREEIREHSQWSREFDKKLEEERIKAKAYIKENETLKRFVAPVEIKERIELKVGSKAIFLSKDALRNGVKGTTPYNNNW